MLSGSRGIDITDEISMDFKVTTDIGTRRLAKAAFEYAKANGNQNVSIITKANIMKKTDGKFLDICYQVAKDYPEIKTDDWFVDITAANLVNDRSDQTSMYSYCLTFTAILLQMRLLRYRAVSELPEAQTLAQAMRCLKQSTAQRREWLQTALQITQIRQAY